MIYIDQETGRMVNIHAPYKGRSRLDTQEIRSEVGVIEVEEDPAPADYDSEFYNRREDWDAVQRPYIIYERRSDEEVAEIMIKRFVANMEAHYDAVAKAKNYDNRYTCALRAGYAGPFQAEGQAFAQWMDACNAYGYQELDKMKQGLRTVPTIDQFIEELPEPPWALPQAGA